MQHMMSVGSVYEKVSSYLALLPHCADITRTSCTRFCGVLLVDGKYVKVKGYDRKIPVLYAIDYTSHDIPTYILSVAENYPTCYSLFQSLRLLNYPLQAVVCDDNQNIYEACRRVYPQAHIQLCLNHYKEHIRESLAVRTDPTYVPFMREIEYLFACKRSEEEFTHVAGKIFKYYAKDERTASVLLDIQRRLPQLTAYMKYRVIPRTTNLIESYNSHLQARLRAVKGFESFTHADSWLNGYFILRRLRKFTDCAKPFKRLNGTASLEHTLQNPRDYARYLRLIR